MQQAIHPEITTTNVVCSNCGTAFTTRSTVAELRLDVCSSCHPAYTGGSVRQAGGSRVEQFNKRWRSAV